MELYKFYTILCILLLIIAVLVFLLVKTYKFFTAQKHRMEEETKIYRDVLERESDIYKRFFPEELPELLGVRQAKDITTKLQRSFVSTVMWVNVLDYTDALHALKAGQLYLAINQVFSSIIPIVMRSGGIIDHFDRAGMNGLYMEQSEAALKAAISMCETVDLLGEPKKYSGFSIGISHGPVMFGIVGSVQRIAAVSMSESIRMSELLQEKASKYGARILATEYFVERIPNFQKNYNSRILGYFYDASQKQMIRIYDIYDGDSQERKQGKRRTRMIFEQGVDRFIHGNYGDARLHFVEVLKADRYDLAAREYLFLCDTLSNGEQKDINICIETF